MSQNTQNPFSIWADMSNNMFDAWKSFSSFTVPQSAESVKKEDGGIVNPFAAYYDFVMKGAANNPMFSSLSNFGTDNIMNQFLDQWQQGIKNMAAMIPNQSVKDGFNRFMESFQLFGGLRPLWETFFKNMPKDMSDWDSFTKTVMKHYQDMSGGLVSMLMPDQIKTFFTMPIENVTAVQQALLGFFAPWIGDSAVLQGHLIKAMQGDKAAYTEFLKTWAETYKNSFAKLLNMPAVGANHANIEKMMKLLDYYVNFVISAGEFTARISTMTTEAMQNIIAHLAELQAEGNPPQTFMDFYKIWSRFNEQAFMDMYATDDFSKLMNETVSAGSKLQILFDDYVQDILAFLPFPNRRELDDVEKEIYNLRKQVKALEKELKALKGLVGAKQ